MGRKKKSVLVDSVERELVLEQSEDVKQSLSEQVEQHTAGDSKNYLMDLRIHSPESLGYLAIEGIDTAPALIRLAKVKGLDMIAVTDFYSADFIDRVVEASLGSPVTVIPGVAIKCSLDVCNDVVLVCLFPEGYSSASVRKFLETLNIPKHAYGDSNYLLDMHFDEILEIVDQFQGVVIPSRMDKTPQRKNVLHIMVEKYGFKAFDLAYADSGNIFKKNWPKQKFHLFSFSNANALAQVGSRRAKIKMAMPGFEGIKLFTTRQSAV